MEEFAVEWAVALRENTYCQKCGTWVYCPEMNMKCKNDLGEEVECIGEGCLEQDEKGDFLKCPDCGTRHYLQG